MLRRYYGKISILPIDQFKGHDGELVVDDITGKVYVMDGVTYGGTELVGATPRFGLTPPENPTDGALWYDPDSGRIFIYYEQQWVDAAPNTTYSLPIAGEDVLGGIRVGNNLYIDEEGRLSAEDGNYVLPTATENDLGGVKVDNASIVIDEYGVISTGYQDRLINGNNTVSLDTNGNLTFPQGTLLGYSDPGGFIIDGAADKDVAIYTYSGSDAQGWTFGTDGNLTTPSGMTIGYAGFIGEAYGIQGNVDQRATVSSKGIDGGSTLLWAKTYDEMGGPLSLVNVDNNGVIFYTGNISEGIPNIFSFDMDGNLSLPPNSTISSQANDLSLYAEGNVNITSKGHKFIFDTDTVGRFIMPPSGVIAGHSTAGNGLNIFVGNTTTEVGNVWNFGTNGNLTLPQYGSINYSNGTSILNGITVGSNYTLLVADANTLGGIKLGEGFTKDGNNKVTTNKLYSTNLTQPTQHYRLTLDTNGVIHLPDESIINGATLKSVAGNYAGITAGPIGKDEDSWVWVDSDGAWIGTKYNTDQKLWQFNNDGGIVFPDGNVQTTAYTGPVQTFVGISAPAGPAEGTMWFDTTDGRTYIYLGNVWVDSNPSSKGEKGDQGNQGIQGNVGPAGEQGPPSVYTGGNLIPTANVTYSIGNVDFWYKELWVSSNTIYMGGVPLSVNQTGSLTVNGNVVGGTYTDANVAAYLISNPQQGLYNNSNVASYIISNPPSGTYSNSNVSAYLIDNPQQGLYSNSNVASYILGAVSLGKTTVADTTNSISTSTGALTVSGGLGVTSDVHIGGTVNITDTTTSTSYDTGALVINGGLGVNGNINLSGNINILEGNINIVEFTGATGNFYGDPTTGFGAMYAGKSGFTALPYTVAQISTNSNSYSQVNIENINSGKLASADYIGTGDIGTDSSWFFDLGIAGSGYDPVLAAQNNAPGTSVGPLDTYLYVQGNVDVPETGGNLTIGTSQNNKVINFIAGGVNAENIVLTLTQDGITANRNIHAPNVYAENYNYSNGTPLITGGSLNITQVNAQTINTQIINANGATLTGLTFNTDIANITANISSLQANLTAANSEISTKTTYSNSNVASYLLGSILVGNLSSTNGYHWANGALYAGTYSNTNVASYLTGTINLGNINLGTAVRFNGTTQTIDTTNGSAISIASRVNFTGLGVGVGMNVTNPATFNSNVTVQGTGGIYLPNRPAFRIYGSGSSYWTTANVNFKGSGITVDYNQGSFFNSSTGIFTAPIAGLYQITLNARIGNNNGMNQIMVVKNGLTTAGNVAVMWECDTNTGTAVHYGVSSVMKLVAGDILSANVTVGSVQFDANDSWTVTYIG